MNLLYNFNQSTVIEKVTMKWPSDEYVIPAGTPMSRTGIANDKNAIGILAREERIQFRYPLSVAKHIGKEEPKGKKDHTFSLITSGFVNLTDAEASFGAKISEEAKAAMGEINFVNETEPASFGGGGGGNMLETVGSDTLTWNGSTEGKLFVPATPDGSIGYYKVGNATPTNEEMRTAILSITMQGHTSEVVIADVWDAMDSQGCITDDFLLLEGSIIVRKDNFAFQFQGVDLTFPEAGVYFVSYLFENENEGSISLIIPNYTGFPPFKEQIKEEYIPDSLKGGGGDSLVTEMVFDGNILHIDGHTFNTTTDFMNDLIVLSDADFETFFNILQKKLVIEITDVARMYYCATVEYDDDLKPWFVPMMQLSESGGYYHFCTTSYQHNKLA